MNLNLTTKERFLLEDQKSQEQMCVDKYSSYANLASCPQLKSLCQSIGQIEQQHLQTINQLLNGQIPAMNNQQQQEQQQGQRQNQMASQQQMSFQSSQGSQSSQQQMSSSQSSGSSQFPKSDKDICSDLLMTEKFVSGLYDTAIFEFTNTQVRDVLNHIQKEEQEHGDRIFKYMESKGMYSPK
jgi:spore coat protein CotF